MIKKIICAVLCLILIGCTGFVLPQRKETIKLPDIHEGTAGIELSYLDGMPPREVFENQLFEIGLELHNTGAADIQNGIYNIALNEQFITILDEKMNRFNAKGKSMYSPLGNKERIQIKARANELGGQMTSQGTTIIANACYEYATKATIMTCIDTQQLKKETKVCQVTEYSSASGQGGPVGIVKVEPKILPHEDPEKIKPSYTIQIENLGKGQVIESGLIYDACIGRSIGKENYDAVLVDAMLSNQVLDCQPRTLKLKQKENKILCELNQGINRNAGNYQTPLTIELNYGYMQTQPKTIQIRRKIY